MALVWVLLAVQPVMAAEDQAAIYYVATNGNDSNPGTQALPWRTLNKASATLKAGDTLYIRAGTYNQQLKPVNDGTASAWITLAAYPGETVTLDGSGIDLNEWGGVVDLSKRQYIRVQGLRVINSTYAGIFSYKGAYLEVLSNFTSNTASSGIAMWNANQVVVRGNEVENACTSLGQETITIAVTSNFLVEGNEIHDSGPVSRGGESIDVKGGSHDGIVRGNDIHDNHKVGLYIDSYDEYTYNIVVTGNRIYNNAEYGMALASEQGGLLENVTVSNNLVYNNKYAGLGIYNCCSGSSKHPVKNVSIVNNTFVFNGWDEWGPGLDIEDPDIVGLTLRNNLIAYNKYTQIDIKQEVPSNQVTSDHNLVYGDQVDANQAGSSAVRSEPRLVNSAANDFHLQSGSPAVDAGSTSLAPAYSLDGTARPQDGNQDGTAQVDIGAYELSGPVPVSPVTPSHWLYLAITKK